MTITKVSTKNKLINFKEVMDEHFGKLNTVFNDLVYVNFASSQEVSDAIQDMVEINAKTNATKGNSAYLSVCVEWLEI